MDQFKVGGFIPSPDVDKYAAFDKNAHIKSALILPGEVDLREYSVKRHNQRNTSSCTAQSTVKALEIKRCIKLGISKHTDLSVLDLYYGARDLMEPKQTDQDNGTYISLVAESVKRFGVCRESMFPFDESRLFIPPPILADRESYLNKVEGHFPITSAGNDRVDDMIANLQVQNPVVFGTPVGDNWFQYTQTSEPLGLCDNPKGGHAMCVVGWVGGLFIVENSWGNTWGNNGFAFVKPELFMSPKTQDLWIYINSSDVWFERGGQ